MTDSTAAKTSGRPSHIIRLIGGIFSACFGLAFYQTWFTLSRTGHLNIRALEMRLNRPPNSLEEVQRLRTISVPHELEVYNRATISPAVWRGLMKEMGVQSVIDIGCGLGYSTTWWDWHGASVKCVEGHPFVGKDSLLRDTTHQLILHDYRSGPLVPQRTFDAAWIVDFISHIDTKYFLNYAQTLRKAAIIVVTWTSWAPPDTNQTLHIRGDDWWIDTFQSQGLEYNSDLTANLREWAWNERQNQVLGPDARPLDAPSLWLQGHVFINPEVTKLEQHTHLFIPRNCSRESSSCEDLSVERDIGWTNYVQDRVRFPFPIPEEKTWWKQVIQYTQQGQGRASNMTTKKPQHSSLFSRQPLPSIDMVPLLKDFQAQDFSSAPIPVVLWPFLETGIRTAEHVHIELDGINQSSYLELSTDLKNFDPNIVWLGDIGCCEPWKIWCRQFAEVALKAQQERRRRQLPLHWPIFIIDFTDGIQLPHCGAVEAVVGASNVRYSTRSLARRYFNEKMNWTKTYQVLDLEQGGHSYLHTPLIVRTDTVASLAENLGTRGHSLSSDIESLERPVDVAHYWPVGDQSMVGTLNSRLRTRIGDILEQLEKEKHLNFFLGLKGRGERTGRRGVNQEYIGGLLETKIVVVSQRDHWEDHYRLMEALIGGALVMTDRMVGLPAGLENGTSIVEFDSEESLRSLIVYYLDHEIDRQEIARRGRRVAMARHRSWHRMEEIVFGQALSNCDEQTTAECAFAVTRGVSKR